MNKLENGLTTFVRKLVRFSGNGAWGKFVSPKGNLRIIAHNLVLLSKYRPWGKSASPMIVYMIDGSVEHMGLADRLRQIMGIYAVAKYKGYKFGLVANYPFELSTFLRPNYNWKISGGKVSRNIFYSRPLYLGHRPVEKYKTALTLNRRQLHVYVSVHWGIIHELGYTIKQLFNELFEPIPEISNFVIDYKVKYISWDCFHFRFINLLGDFNEPQAKKLNDSEKEILLNKCYEFILEESQKSSNHLLVCSDSFSFLKKISSIPQVIVLPGEPIHIDYTKDNNFGLHLKTFQDFFMMAASNSICSVTTDDMYMSDFPALAGHINDVPFKRIKLN